MGCVAPGEEEEAAAAILYYTCVCGRSLSGIVGSNPAEAWMFVVSVVCCQVEVSATD